MRAEDINSLESESGIIASLIHHPEFSFYSEHLLPKHFINNDNRCVYTAICNLARKGVSNVDAYIIIEDLNSSEATRPMAQTLTVDKLQELVEMSDILARSSVEEYKILVSNVYEAAFRRTAFQVLKECQALCFDRTLQNVPQKIYAAVDNVMTDFSAAEDIPVFGDVVDEVWAEVEAHQDGKECGLPLKIDAFKEYVSYDPGELVVVAAQPKGGKSIWCLNEAVDKLRMGKSVMYIDSELSDRLFLCRLISHLSGVEFYKIKNGNYDKADEFRINQCREWIKKQKLIHLYMPIFDQQSIYTAVKKVYHRFDPLDFLIVDYLKATGEGDAHATYAELGRLTDMIKNDLAGKMNMPALAAAQLTDTGRIADSRKIVNHASTIIKLFDKTPEEVMNDGTECGNKKMIIAYNRNGMQHAYGEYISVNFEGNVVAFENCKQAIPVTPY